MKSVLAVTFMLILSACATDGRQGEAKRVASARDSLASCSPGYVEYPSGSGVCRPYDQVQQQQQQAGPIRQTFSGAMAQPAPSIGGLRR